LISTGCELVTAFQNAEFREIARSAEFREIARRMTYAARTDARRCIKVGIKCTWT
jgi:hypothetical protein